MKVITLLISSILTMSGMMLQNITLFSIGVIIATITTGYIIYETLTNLK